MRPLARHLFTLAVPDFGPFGLVEIVLILAIPALAIAALVVALVALIRTYYTRGDRPGRFEVKLKERRD